MTFKDENTKMTTEFTKIAAAMKQEEGKILPWVKSHKVAIVAIVAAIVAIVAAIVVIVALSIF